MAVDNPFPLNIVDKQDTWEKVQQMANVPEDFKYTASEFNKLLQALQYLYESGSGPAVWGSLQGNIELQTDLINLIASGGSKPVENRYTESPSNTIATMLADQSNQTTGFLQLVGDASADPDVASGKAYYEKKASNTGSLSDYERLTPEQTELLESSFSYLIKRVKGKGSAVINLTLTASEIFVLSNPSTSTIKSFIFDSAYSKILAKAIALFAQGEPVKFSIVNKTRNTNIIAKVTSFDTYEATDYVIANIELTGDYKVPFNTIGQGDSLHMFLPQVGGGEGPTSQSLDEVLTEGNTSDTDIVLEDEAAFIASDPNDIERFIKMYVSAGFRGLLEFHEDGYKTTLLANAPNSNRTVRLPNLTATLIAKINNKLAGLDGMLTLYQSDIKGTTQQELIATGAITADFTSYSAIHIIQTAAVTLSITPPTLAIGEHQTVFFYLEPSSFAITLPSSLTDQAVGADIDDLDATYWIATTFMNQNGTIKPNPSNISKL